MSNIHSLQLNSTYVDKLGASKTPFKVVLQQTLITSLICLIGASAVLLEIRFILGQLFLCFALKLFTAILSLVYSHCLLSQSNEDLIPVQIGATETNILRDLQKRIG